MKRITTAAARHTGALRRLRSLFVVTLVAPLLAACVSAQRTEISVSNCTPDREGNLVDSNPCAHKFAELAESHDGPAEGRYRYTLYFAEFDDQGWSTVNGEDQMEAVIRSINGHFHGEKRPGDDPCVSQGDHGYAPVNFIVFVHGWKHTADVNDGNVVSFRRILREAAAAECRGAKREVVGLYVGWRGKSIDLGDLGNDINFPSFWTRKNAAADLAQGQVRELFFRLDVMADAVNAPYMRSLYEATRRNPRPRGEGGAGGKSGRPSVEEQRKKPIRMLLIGHSFGAHILLTSLGGSVLRNIASGIDDEHACDKPLQRDGDLVLLVNPAIEGTKFEPLFNAARKWKAPCYKAPMFVAVTSEGDWATRWLFPAGRWVSTFFESYPRGADERTADRSTFANDSRYQTHRLFRATDGEPSLSDRCKAWNASTDVATKVTAEYEHAQEFGRYVSTHGEAPPSRRQFCAGTVLSTLDKWNPEGWNKPVMVISASKELIADHNAIYGPQFVSFVRELYMDSLDPRFQAK